MSVCCWQIFSVDWSIVSGLYDRNLVVILRNDGLRKDAGNVAQKSFAAAGSAGGHKSSARAEIPLENLKIEVDPGNNKKLLNWIIKRIEKRAENK
jgi:nanoRNase/pAp phosphatase (c-di-AMP/oligoRNAs hydrolase)